METVPDRKKSSGMNDPLLVRHLKHVLDELARTRRRQACLDKRVTSLSETVHQLTDNLESLSDRQDKLDGRVQTLATDMSRLTEETSRRFAEVQAGLQALMPKIDMLLGS